MTSHVYRGGFLFALLSSVFLLAPLGAARAQSLDDGWGALEGQWNNKRKLISDLMRGKKAANPEDKNDVEALDLNARYHTYHVYLDHLENPEPKRASRPSIDRAFSLFEYDLDSLQKKKPTTQTTIDIFRDKVRLHALEVLKHDKPVAVHKVHNARILAEIAKFGQPQLAETLVAVLQDDKQNAGVQYYILRGLSNLLSLVRPMQMPPLLTKEQQSACAEALVSFLANKKGPGKGASQEEIDGFRLLRREAIRALAQIHQPAISDKVRPALTLARFAGNDGGIQPPPRIDERMEAALGLAHMQPAQDNMYQSDYAACQLGRCLGTFAQQANNERQGERTRPWKIDAYHLRQSLTTLKGVSGKNPYVAQVIERGTRMLGEIMKGSQANATDVTWFTTPQSDPPSKELFKGAADTTVKPGQAEESPSEKQ